MGALRFGHGRSFGAVATGLVTYSGQRRLMKRKGLITAEGLVGHATDLNPATWLLDTEDIKHPLHMPDLDELVLEAPLSDELRCATTWGKTPSRPC